MVGSFAERPPRALRLVAHPGGDDEGIPGGHASRGGQHRIEALRDHPHDEHATGGGIQRKLREQAAQRGEHLLDARRGFHRRRVGVGWVGEVGVFLRLRPAPGPLENRSVNLRDGAQRLQPLHRQRHRLRRGRIHGLRQERLDPGVGHRARLQARRLQRGSLNLRRRPFGHRLEHRPGVEPVTHTRGDAAGAAGALRRGRPGRGHRAHGAHRRFRVVAHLPDQAAVDDGEDVVDGDGRLGDVGGEDHLDLSRGRRVEHQLLLFLGHLRVQGNHLKRVVLLRWQRLERLHRLLDLVPAREEHEHRAFPALGELRGGDLRGNLRGERDDQLLALALVRDAAALPTASSPAGHLSSAPRGLPRRSRRHRDSTLSAHLHRASQRSDPVREPPAAPLHPARGVYRPAALHLDLELLPFAQLVHVIVHVIVLVVVVVLVGFERVRRALLGERLLQLALQELVLRLEQRPREGFAQLIQRKLRRLLRLVGG